MRVVFETRADARCPANPRFFLEVAPGAPGARARASGVTDLILRRIKPGETARRMTEKSR